MKKKPVKKSAKSGEKIKKPVGRMDTLATEGTEGMMVSAEDFQALQNDFDIAKGHNIDLGLAAKELKDKLAVADRELKALRESEPPKLDKKKIQNALNAVLYSLLMDAKGALMVSGDPSAAEVAIRISQAELNMPALTLAETMLVQRAKAMSRKFMAGMEVDKEEISGFFKLVEKLS